MAKGKFFSPMLPNFRGASYAGIGDPPGGTELHLSLLAAAEQFRAKGGSPGSAAKLLTALSEFMGKLEIFRPIVEVWPAVRRVGILMLDEKAVPVGHEKAGNRGLHVPCSYLERKMDGWTEINTLVLCEDTRWGIVWIPKHAPTTLYEDCVTREEFRKHCAQRFKFELVTPRELGQYKLLFGGDTWGVVSSLLREVLLSQQRAEHRAEFLSAISLILHMTQQITYLSD